MDRTLAEFAAEGAPLEVRLKVALALARAVEALHRRRRVHGALAPEAVRVAGDGGEAVVLAPPRRPGSPLERAGWAAPEIVRGGAPSRRSDAFAAGALVRLALTGRGPFDAGDPAEIARRVLFEEPRPARLEEPDVPEQVDLVIAGLLERRPWRRAGVGEIVRVLEGVTGGSTSTSTATPTATPTPTPTPTATATATATAVRVPQSAAAVRVPRSGAFLRSLLRRIPPSPLHRAGLAAVPLFLVALALLRGPDAALGRDVAALLARGETAAARARIDQARGADRALVEKLRGDVACARNASGECLRRYRTALAARPALRDDAALRRNVRALLARDEGCGTRRSAALLAGELRDPEALPALESARRSGGVLAFLCTGDAIDRAIAATRAVR